MEGAAASATEFFTLGQPDDGFSFCSHSTQYPCCICMAFSAYLGKGLLGARGSRHREVDGVSAPILGEQVDGGSTSSSQCSIGLLSSYSNDGSVLLCFALSCSSARDGTHEHGMVLIAGTEHTTPIGQFLREGLPRHEIATRGIIASAYSTRKCSCDVARTIVAIQARDITTVHGILQWDTNPLRGSV